MWKQLGPLNLFALNLQSPIEFYDQHKFVFEKEIGTAYYSGQQIAYKQDGIGREVFYKDDNEIQEGQFEDGKLNGYARVIFEDGDYYEGYY
jgi:hypothetical protein